MMDLMKLESETILREAILRDLVHEFSGNHFEFGGKNYSLDGTQQVYEIELKEDEDGIRITKDVAKRLHALMRSHQGPSEPTTLLLIAARGKKVLVWYQNDEVAEPISA